MFRLYYLCYRVLFAVAALGIATSSNITAQGQNNVLKLVSTDPDTALVQRRSFSEGLSTTPTPAKGVAKVVGLNSPARDNNPIVTADGSILFFNSTRKGNRPWARYDTAEARYDEDIYYAVRLSSKRNEEVWSEPINLGPKINSKGDDGVVAISPDGQTIFFNSLKSGWEYDGGPFYAAKLHGTEWANINGLGGDITRFFTDRDKRKRFKVYGATISSDGKDFYFATTAYSESGQHQIWVSHLQDNNQWGTPESLGPEVNAGEGNYAPFIAADNKTLLFASRRKGGYGGDDIYVTVLKDSHWTKPINVGEPINSAGDESFLSLTASGERVYLSSSREGNDEIYTVPPPPELRPASVVLLSGCVTDKNGMPVEATVVVEDLKTGQLIFDAGSNSASGEYMIVLQPGREYGISISTPGFVFLSDHYRIPVATTYQEFVRDFQLKKLAEGENFVVNNVFFEYNVSMLDQASRPELDRLVSLLSENPILQIEVEGHTDSRGAPRYNKQLSLKRAKAVKEYLITAGNFSPDRIKVRGYGSEKPIADNETDDGRRHNRRTEFRVLNSKGE